MGSPKILLFDVETSPSIAYIWRLWEEVTSMSMVADDWYVLCWSAKWLGEKEIMSSSIKRKGENDKRVMQDLWKLLDEADIIVAHNAVKFDCRKANTRFLMHNLTPPSPSIVIDTLKVVKNKFMFTSNKLGDLGKFLKVGEKMDTGGIDLWKRCMNGEKKALKKMVLYCKQDVKLLEKIYLKLRPYISNHPNLGVLSNDFICPECGSYNVQKRGYAVTSACKYQRFQCQDCAGWSKGRKKVQKGDTLSSL